MHITRRRFLPLGPALLAATGPAQAQDEALVLEGAEVIDGERRLGPTTILVAGASSGLSVWLEWCLCRRARAASTSQTA